MSKFEVLSALRAHVQPEVAAAIWEVVEEIGRQDAKWGDQSGHPDGTGPNLQFEVVSGMYPELGECTNSRMRDAAREDTDRNFRNGVGTWFDILTEEFFEVAAEGPGSPELQTELVQVAAVAAQWRAAQARRDSKTPGQE